LGTELKMENKTAGRAPKNRRKLIRTLLRRIEKEFKGKETKATLADYIRLTQLERELEDQEQPREIIITWSEPAETQSVER
jgi:hypothetical protein